MMLLPCCLFSLTGIYSFHSDRREDKAGNNSVIILIRLRKMVRGWDRDRDRAPSPQPQAPKGKFPQACWQFLFIPTSPIAWKMTMNKALSLTP